MSDRVLKKQDRKGTNMTRRVIGTIVIAAAAFTAGAWAQNARFSDVTADNPHKAAIEWAADRGIIEGRTDGLFRPDLAVTRGQMASILRRAFDQAGVSVPATTPTTTPPVVIEPPSEPTPPAAQNPPAADANPAPSTEDTTPTTSTPTSATTTTTSTPEAPVCSIHFNYIRSTTDSDGREYHLMRPTIRSVDACLKGWYDNALKIAPSGGGGFTYPAGWWFQRGLSYRNSITCRLSDSHSYKGTGPSENLGPVPCEATFDDLPVTTTTTTAPATTTTTTVPAPEPPSTAFTVENASWSYREYEAAGVEAQEKIYYTLAYKVPEGWEAKWEYKGVIDAPPEGDWEQPANYVWGSAVWSTADIERDFEGADWSGGTLDCVRVTMRPVVPAAVPDSGVASADLKNYRIAAYGLVWSACVDGINPFSWSGTYVEPDYEHEGPIPTDDDLEYSSIQVRTKH